MPKHKLDAPNVDLRCILCPKNPTFSDISHLLTHISSKSHLAAKFKLQVESRNQQHAKDKLENFEFWYTTNNLDEMLVDRLAAKEDKKKKKIIRGSLIKREYKAPDDGYDSSSFRAPRANMHPFPTRSATTRPTNQWDQSIYSTPTSRSKVPNFSAQETLADDPIDPMLATPWRPDQDDDEDDKSYRERITDSAKLKGIQWPGMTVFDAATPEGKRMRNQRKDSKVLRDMIATSKVVEPAEISYHANGEFRGSRDIFGPLSAENSPVQPKRPTPKKRNTRKPRKPTFENLSTNRPRIRNTRGRRVADRMDPYKNTVSNPYRLNVYQHSPPTLNPLAVGFTNNYSDHRYLPSLDEDEEYRFTIGGMGKKKRFSIFEDEISPMGTESPLEEARFDFQNHESPDFQKTSIVSTHIPPSPTPLAKPAPRNCNGINGSNGGRGFNTMQDQREMLNHSHARRTMSDSHLLAPQSFLHDFNPLFSQGNHSYTRSTGSYNAQYMFGNQSNNYVENNMHISPSRYSSSFMNDFRQMDQTTDVSMLSTSQPQEAPPIADLETTSTDDNDLQFDM